MPMYSSHTCSGCCVVNPLHTIVFIFNTALKGGEADLHTKGKMARINENLFFSLIVAFKKSYKIIFYMVV